MKEPKRALCSLDVNTSAVAEHCIKKSHSIDWKSARVLKKENKLHQRCYWASEASPTLGCSIEISRDIYIYVCRYVCLSWSKMRRRNYVRACSK